MPDDARLDALELSVARLTRELVALRAEVRTLAATSGARASVAESVTPREPRGVEGRGASDPSTSEGRASEWRATEGRVSDAQPEGPVVGAQPSREGPYVSDELRRIAMSGRPAPGVGGTSAGRDARSAASAHSPSWVTSRADVERLIGRYGTLALAALTILMGVGAFLGWAVRNGLIGPELRVAAGAVAAAVVAGIGWRMRQGRSSRFGDILLALALAIVHVDCWGAGPLLGIVPGAVALGIAAAASAALAALSLREEDQSLFNVGFGGALLAPFVTSSGRGDPLLLLVYGAVVLAAGMHALRDREWSKTPLVMMLGIVAFTASATGVLQRELSWPRATAPALFAVGVAWLALLLVRGVPRSRVAHVALVSALGALAPLALEETAAWSRVVLAFIVTLTAYAASNPEERGARKTLLGVLALPLAALAIALVAIHDATSARGATIALAWALAAAGAAAIDRDGERAAHAFTAASAGGLALFLYFGDELRWWVPAIAAYGAALSLLLPRLRLGSVALAVGGWLTIAALGAFSLLDERVAYAYRPFLTEESTVAAAISFAWLVFSWNAARFAVAGGLESAPTTLVRVLGALVAFFWVRAELAEAFSRDASTFLLIAYYAVAGVFAIGMGRWRAIPVLRQGGLALAVYAAFKAILQASAMAIGWRVGGYLLAGAFLLGVAYWYRSSAKSEGAGATNDATGLA